MATDGHRGADVRKRNEAAYLDKVGKVVRLAIKVGDLCEGLENVLFLKFVDAVCNILHLQQAQAIK